jgi:PIN domain nuclease of toxin-antitoxin system
VPETAYVTDTHPLLFFASRDRRLSRRAAAHFSACEERSALTYVPMAVLWECALLVRRRRIALRPSFQGFFEDLFSNPAYQPLDLTSEQIFVAEQHRPNDDPFDALICAAARTLSLPLLTRDGEIEESGLVRVVW